MPRLHKPGRCLHQMLIIYGLIFVSSATTLPDRCDSIKCPPDAELECPADSSVRENVVDLMIKSNAVDLPAANAAHAANGNGEISETDFAECCLARKCVCKTCYIPDCDPEGDEVVMVLAKENMHLPGACCGKYECRPKPDCTDVHEIGHWWLHDCQKCRCMAGEKICHQSCDEEATAGEGSAGGFCESKTLNQYFNDGESWKDGCQECECVRGETKCVISFCGNLNCPSERQVTLMGTCCPVCWPNGAPMPHEKRPEDNGVYDYKDTESKETETETLPPLLPDLETTQQSGDLIASTTTSTTAAPPPTTPAGCHYAFDPPKVVGLLSQSSYISYWLIAYSVLATIIIAFQGGYICKQRAKKRSYAPVSILDHSI